MKIIICGICGRMGNTLLTCIEEYENISVIAGVDENAKLNLFNDIPIFNSFKKIDDSLLPNCIIDFSSPKALSNLLSYSLNNKIPTVLATTGYNDIENETIFNASLEIPIFKSGNMSTGIATMLELVDLASTYLSAYADIEILESHHNKKIDSPSGTAKMLFEKIKTHNELYTPVHGRLGLSSPRTAKEVGIHSIRGGTIAGKHEVQFILNNEIITISHEAENRSIFAHGSIRAAEFLISQKPGLYYLRNLLKNNTKGS